jgi:conjugal transfer/type IV secretion protein DotA/TraY
LTIAQALSTSSGMGFSAGAGFAVSALANGISSIAGMGVAGGMVLMFYVPVLPLIRTTFAALTWIISVFEAVAMVPMAALNFLTSVGEGMGARETWILWLNVLMRPVLVVIGFVGAMLIFNSFVVYFQTNFTQGIAALRSDMNWITRFLSWFAYTAIYVFAVYTAANSSFKLLDLIPDAMMRWMGGRADVSFDDNSSVGALAAGQMVGGFRGTDKAFTKNQKTIDDNAKNKAGGVGKAG